MKTSNSSSHSAEQVRELFLRIKPTIGDILSVERWPKGHGTECWLVRYSTGNYLLKIALQAHPAEVKKMRNIQAAIDIVNQHGITAPRLIYFEPVSAEFDDKAILVQEYLSGADAEEVFPLLSKEEKGRFFFDLGRAVSKFHAINIGGFTRNLPQKNVFLRWSDYVRDQIEIFLESNFDAGVLTPEELRQAEKRIMDSAAAVSSDIIPSLVHQDIWLPNILMENKKFKCLIDLEYAKSVDRYYEFVTLRMRVFDKFPDAEKIFFNGYELDGGYTQIDEQRLSTCLGMEILTGIPYFKRVGWKDMLEDYLTRFKQWSGS